MADPIEDGGAIAALQLASLVDANFNSPPNDDPWPSTQAGAERGARWAAWVRDILTLALESLENGNQRVRLDGPMNGAPVDKDAIKAAKTALSTLAKDHPPAPSKRERVIPRAADLLQVP